VALLARTRNDTPTDVAAMSEMRPIAELSAADGALVAALAVPHPRPFTAELVVDESHLSRLIPHANNVEYLRWIDRVAELHADSLGHTREALLRIDRCFFVARHEIDYLAECWVGERLLIVTWVRSMRKTTSWRDTVVVRANDRALIARSSTLWAFVDLTSRRPARIPASMTTSFEPLSSADESQGVAS
jgi:acyl-CoA thioester hydrolase